MVVATGGYPATLDVPGVDRKNVAQAVDVITGKAKVGNRVVVVGGRYIGMEVALSLAKKGKRISLVTRRALGRDVERNIFLTLRQKLAENGVLVYPDSLVFEILRDGVYVVQNRDIFLKANSCESR